MAKKGNQKDMHPLQKSKKMAYEEPPKDIAEAQANSRQRILERRNEYLRKTLQPPVDERIEHEKQEILIGQLKAAEARNRLRIMRLRYQANREREIRHLISCQPTALKAVRLQALLPQKLFHDNVDDSLSKIDRERVEDIVENSLSVHS